MGTCGTEAQHCVTELLKSSIKIVSNTVSGTTRTVVLTRPFAGASKDHYSERYSCS